MKLMLKLNKVMLLALLGLFIGFASSAIALQKPEGISSDKRIKLVKYIGDDVYKFTGHYGFQSSIEFHPDERIETISMGDSMAWQVADFTTRIFIKPVEFDATTNMTVITNERVYNFELHAAEAEDISDPNLTFVFRFIYDDLAGSDTFDVATQDDFYKEELPDYKENPAKYNFSYSISGSNEVAPIRIFDDGDFTYMEFRDQNSEIPAIFHVDGAGNEQIVNYRTVKDFIIVERVSSRFTLRAGPNVVCVFNEANPLEVIKEEESFFSSIF